MNGFTSAFAADLENYLAFKAATGCHGGSRIWHLKQFDAYCDRHQLAVFDKATVESWVEEHLKSSTHRSWMSYIRDFGRWLVLHRNPNAYVLTSAWKSPFVRADPYLLTADQIERFFTSAADFPGMSPWRWQATAFFVLMHSCGLRTGEARHLTPSQVDLDRETITILDSKGHRNRRLPITTDVADILAVCNRETRKKFTARATFFVSSTGNQVDNTSTGTAFRRIWDQAGLPRPANSKQPRPYDFRHHFAYANIERWMADGTDTAAMLPYLAAYMGHSSIESTYYYIHTSPDFLDAYADITRRTSESRLPKAGF